MQIICKLQHCNHHVCCIFWHRHQRRHSSDRSSITFHVIHKIQRALSVVTTFKAHFHLTLIGLCILQFGALCAKAIENLKQPLHSAYLVTLECGSRSLKIVAIWLVETFNCDHYIVLGVATTLKLDDNCTFTAIWRVNYI